jgi:hypothetical protein
LSVLLVPGERLQAAEESALLFALLEGGASDGVQEGDDQADAGKEVEDGEELAGGGLGGPRSPYPTVVRVMELK